MVCRPFWLFVSAALHGLLCWLAVAVAPASLDAVQRRSPVERPDIWQAHWVELTAGQSAFQAAGADRVVGGAADGSGVESGVESAAEEPLAEQPTGGEEPSREQPSRKQPEPRRTEPASQPPADQVAASGGSQPQPENPASATAPARASNAPGSAKSEATTDRSDEPTEPSASNDANEPGDDWFGEPGDVHEDSPTDESDAKPPEAERDRLVERLLAAERRRATEKRAAQNATQRQARQPAPAIDPGMNTRADATRDLATAFSRAVPYAANADPLWQRLPLGDVGQVTITLDLSSGRLGERYQARPALQKSSPLARLIERTVALLQRGRLALHASDRKTGQQRLSLSVTLSQEAARDALKIGFQAPSGKRPGRGYFVLESGRRFDAEIRPLP